MEILNAINLEQLGTAGILVAFLLYQNWQLQKDKREDRDEIKDLNQALNDISMKAVVAISEFKLLLSDFLHRR